MNAIYYLYTGVTNYIKNYNVEYENKQKANENAEALFLACIQKNKEMIELLLKNIKLNINYKINDIFINKITNENVIELMKNIPIGNTILMSLVILKNYFIQNKNQEEGQKYMDIIKMLLHTEMIDLTIKNLELDNILMICIKYDDIETLKLLIDDKNKYYINVNDKDKNGKTILNITMDTKKFNFIEEILKCEKINIENIMTQDNKTLKVFAVENNNLEIVRLVTNLEQKKIKNYNTINKQQPIIKLKNVT